MDNRFLHRRSTNLKWRIRSCCLLLITVGFPFVALCQVESGSNGSDGDFTPASPGSSYTNIVIDMSLRPDGIYHYKKVNIPSRVTVYFIPNANNTPVVWLVQADCIIDGTISLNGELIPVAGSGVGGVGGPGGFRGGSSGSGGQGPGGGKSGFFGGNGSFRTRGEKDTRQADPGEIYGNTFLVPLFGGSGGGGGTNLQFGAGGGGGAILIAASDSIALNGNIVAQGANSIAYDGAGGGGAGSGGSVRLVTKILSGTGQIIVNGGAIGPDIIKNVAGWGRVRLDVLENRSSVHIPGAFSQGFQPIILPVKGQGIELTIASVGGVAVSPNPSGALSTPDAIISAQQANPVPIVVHCSNVPLNTPITVSVKPANGPTISVVGYNNNGTQESSTATILLNMPRGGGILYATAATLN